MNQNAELATAPACMKVLTVEPPEPSTPEQLALPTATVAITTA